MPKLIIQYFISSLLHIWPLGSAGMDPLFMCLLLCCCCSVAKLCPTLCNPHGLQQARLPCPSLSPRICSNSCPLTPTICWISFTLFSSCPQSLPASESFPMSWLFASRGQSIGASTSASVLPMNIQSWFPLGLTGWISMQSKGLSSLLLGFCEIHSLLLYHCTHFHLSVSIPLLFLYLPHFQSYQRPWLLLPNHLLNSSTCFFIPVSLSSSCFGTFY